MFKNSKTQSLNDFVIKINNAGEQITMYMKHLYS